MPGPVPKRSDARLGHRTKAELAGVTKARGAARVVVPEPADEWHPIAADLFRSLAESGQSAFYEPSDWQRARLAAELTSRALGQSRPPAQLFAVIDSMWADLLTTEGSRRRLRLELERSMPDEGAEQADRVARMEEFRRRAATG